MPVPNDVARQIVRKMLKDFEHMPEEKRLAMLIITIHQDIGFEVLFPQEWKDLPIVLEYYNSKKGRGLRRSQTTSQFCRNVADPLMPEWSALFKKYLNEN
jgi:hypothetical protein